ncbi:hypothetical protein AB0G15_15190 [Streptosporangium sp. NPDC023825]|uniref:hypothetical protein n=1 Tax=Streptosporangium sp. NPDC023825 TaxID=3154909 RepID=UPI003443EE69
MAGKAQEWLKRINFGEGRDVPLDFGVELWKQGLFRYETKDGIVAVLDRLGRPHDPERIMFEVTRSLLDDVVDAAGGVERAYNRLYQAMEASREYWDRWKLRELAVPEPGIIDPRLEDAWYALEELLIWARSMDDRLCRRSVIEGYKADQGLVPALEDGPRREAVLKARMRLHGAGVQEARFLADLGLHMQSSRAGTKSGVLRKGQIFLPFPDPVTDKIKHRWQLTYDKKRDGVRFADNLMRGVERFMDEMLDAFEEHLPERYKS